MKTDISHIIVGKQVSSNIFMQLENVMLIRYVHAWGGQIADRKWWEGTINGEIEDWNSVEQLINKAQNKNIPWVVLRYHKNGKVSCINKSN